MPDFDDLRNNLNQTRNAKEQARLSLFIQKEKLERIRREKETLQRIFDKENKEHHRKLKELERLEKKSRGQIAEFSAAFDNNIKLEAGILAEFTPFTDPREFIGNLNDRYPILLMPVRIETRFKTVAIAGAPEKKQLWVRIFPDECAIDTFESVPSKNEMEDTRFYWNTMWQAGGHESLERAAWRTLVSSYGSGRAAWLVKNYRPENEDEKPKKDKIEDLILVISAIQVPADNDKEAILKYWKAFWLADGDGYQEKEAFQELTAAVGEGPAARYIKSFVPENIKYAPPAPYTRQMVNVQVVFLDFPAPEKADTKLQSWSQAPRTTVLPDRFVLIGYENNTVAFEKVGNVVPSPLVVGPDPSLDEDKQIKKQNGEIVVNEEMKWMVDFEEAIKKGLGFRIDLTPIQAQRGFTRIIALGVKLSADEQLGRQQLEKLVEHHKNSRKGFSILAQGTATNNTEREGAGYKSLDDPDVSFDIVHNGKLFELTNEVLLKKDGQWLAESLGISDSVLQDVFNADGTDQCEARAMNTALWPATMGYMMDTLMQPLFTDNDVEATRNFFNAFILGRGSVPTIKIGKQPYGIYPVTAFSKIGWLQPRRAAFTLMSANENYGFAVLQGNFMMRLYDILKKIDADWTKDHLGKVSHVSKSGDAHQILLDILGLNPDSVEFYQRYAESFEEFYNRMSLMGAGGALIAIFLGGGYVRSGKDLLTRFGFKGDDLPDILEKLFLKSQNLLKGPLIDDVPLSETTPIRNYTPDPNASNYIRWLINAASTSHDKLRKQEGFIDNKIPTALLYLMLNHAIDLNFVEAALKLHLKAELLSQDQMRIARLEPPFIHIAENVKTSESKWQYLYKKDTRITGNQDVEIGEYISQVLTTEVATAYLKEQIKALECLENASTAALERAFVEHIDLCTYRLDAWKNGLFNYQLLGMRQAVGDDNEQYYQKGVYLGAWGILENVKPEFKNLTEINDLDDDLMETFLANGTPLYKDDKNGGYIAAPSLNHAVTAAVLRNGYMVNATKNNPGLLKVNLSSERVRKALGLIEGIRAGQSLAELLGYQLERGLHDNYPSLELDFYIYELRRAFPLRANRLKDTKTEDDEPIENVEARNVVDGLRLIEHLKTLPENAVYPYGKPLSTDGLNSQITDAIRKEVDKIRDLNDAISDVAIAESVHQVVQGNYDRGAATLNTYSKGAFPPIPDVVQTPRSGVNITHRVGIHLEAGLDMNNSPFSFPMTPRAKAEPALNKWLADMLPAPGDVACKVVYFDYGSDSNKEMVVTQENLKLQPIDMLHMLDTEMEQAMGKLDEVILQFAIDSKNIRPDAEIKIRYLEKITGKISFFEVSPLIDSLRSIVSGSRPLEAQDVSRPTEDKEGMKDEWFLDKQRITVNVSTLKAIKATTEALQTSIAIFTGADPINVPQIINEVDGWAGNVISVMKNAHIFGLPLSATGQIYDGKANIFRLIIKKAGETVERLENKLTRYGKIMTDVAAASTDQEKIDLMIGAEMEISTTSTSPIPATVAAYQSILNSKESAFKAKRDALKAISSTTTTSVKTLYDNLNAPLPLTDIDHEKFDIKSIEDQIVRFATDMASLLNSLGKDIGKRTKKADDLIILHDASADARKKVEALVNAGKAIFGDDFNMIHEFITSEDQGNEWAKSLNDEPQLLDYQINTKMVDFPMDNWLYGLARVREKLHHWENIVFMREAFGKPGLPLRPVQLPYKENDHWTGLEYPEDYEITEDKLLYTAYYSTPYDKTKKQCGLLVDEWTELIPSKEETAGITFHYDRPNSEPPQVMLLAMPTDFRGEWQWNDLVDTVIETMDMARKRAIEPDQVDDSAYARFLPAIVASTTVRPITPSLNFSFNNNLHLILKKDGN